jgi:AcrR family transcriptional regulator
MTNKQGRRVRERGSRRRGGRRGGRVRECHEDRRVRRTKRLLRGALASLVHEKPYDAIAVKEILARADVGRSAFYAHFGDKDALLDSAIRETLRASASCAPGAAPVDAVLGFSGPLLEHVERRTW